MPGCHIAASSAGGARLCVAFSPDGQWIAGGSGDGRIGFWDAETGAKVVAFRTAKEGVNSIAFSPDGAGIVGGSGDGVIRVWSTQGAR